MTKKNCEKCNVKRSKLKVLYDDKNGEISVSQEGG